MGRLFADELSRTSDDEEFAAYRSLDGRERSDRLGLDLFNVIHNDRGPADRCAKRAERLWHLLGVSVRDEIAGMYVPDGMLDEREKIHREALVRTRLAHVAGYVWYNGIMMWGESPSRASLEKLSIELIVSVWTHWLALHPRDRDMPTFTLQLKVMCAEMARGSRYGKVFETATRTALSSIPSTDFPAFVERLMGGIGC